MTQKHNKQEFFRCPFCGEPVLETSTSCPQCGSDGRTGWSDQTYLDNVDFGTDESYDEILEKEFGGEKKTGKVSWKLITGAVLLFLFVLIVGATLLR